MRIILILIFCLITTTANAFPEHRSYWIKLPKSHYLVDLGSFHISRKGITGRFYDQAKSKGVSIELDIRRCEKTHSKIAQTACHLLSRANRY